MIADSPFPRRCFAWTLAGLMCVCLPTGCGGPRIYKVKPDVARQTLTQALNQWKSGATPDALRKLKPEIVVQDFDWIGGAKLADYEVLGPGEARDANLSIQVKLSLVDPAGKESSKVVSYLVGTGPVLTVFRDMF